jgi:hypothetical protein
MLSELLFEMQALPVVWLAVNLLFPKPIDDDVYNGLLNI